MGGIGIMTKQEWFNYTTGVINELGYFDKAKDNMKMVSVNGNTYISINFKRTQDAYGITRALKGYKETINNDLFWVIHEKDYYSGFSSSYSSRVQIRPNWNIDRMVIKDNNVVILGL